MAFGTNSNHKSTFKICFFLLGQNAKRGQNKIETVYSIQFELFSLNYHILLLHFPSFFQTNKDSGSFWGARKIGLKSI